MVFNVFMIHFDMTGKGHFFLEALSARITRVNFLHFVIDFEVNVKAMPISPFGVTANAVKFL